MGMKKVGLWRHVFAALIATALLQVHSAEAAGRTRSPASSTPASITVLNDTSLNVGLYWVNFNGDEVFYGEMRAEQNLRINTYVGHIWRLRRLDTGDLLGETSDPKRQVLTLNVSDLSDSADRTDSSQQSGADVPSHPPFDGQIFVSHDVFRSYEPTVFEGLTYKGQKAVTMFDRRGERWNTAPAHVFLAAFSDLPPVEVQVNTEFDRDLAERHARKYAAAVGRLPTILRTRVKTMWIHNGHHPFGGGNDNILIHTVQGEDYERNGFLEEALCHEASHASLDPQIKGTKGWIAAQKADPTFVSTYAATAPEREDVAESFCLHYAVTKRRGRMDPDAVRKIEAAMPHRIEYFNRFISQ